MKARRFFAVASLLTLAGAAPPAAILPTTCVEVPGVMSPWDKPELAMPEDGQGAYTLIDGFAWQDDAGHWHFRFASNEIAYGGFPAIALASGARVVIRARQDAMDGPGVDDMAARVVLHLPGGEIVTLYPDDPGFVPASGAWVSRTYRVDFPIPDLSMCKIGVVATSGLLASARFVQDGIRVVR